MSPAPRAAEPAEVRQIAAPRFLDRASACGLEFTYRNGEAGRSLMVEAIGGGVGWLDFDRDSRWDLYAVQGGDPTPTDRATEPSDCLFRNHADGRFRNVSSTAGIIQPGYGQGVSIADFDDDGFDDIYITNVGANVLLHNMGDGTFVDVTARAGVAQVGWSSSSGWGDLDGDGDLDLYVCNYLDYDPRDPIDCRNKQGEHRICHPRDIPAVADEVFLNQGDGTFRAAARALGIEGPGNKALGVAIADFTGDQRPDIYVANDTEANFLFVARPDGGFRESALELGCAVDRNGRTQASMGVAVGDYDGDQFDDLYVTHFHDESNTLYHSLGTAGFEDVTGLTGLHDPTLPRLGFGAVMTDFNADGFQDLLVANGHIENYPGNPLLKMQPQLFSWNGLRWGDRSEEGGPFFGVPQVGRGVAAADYDGDGDLDVAIVHQNAPLALLENVSPRGHWLAVECVGRSSNRRGIGCRITVTTKGSSLMQQLRGGTSYASSHQPIAFFGLGPTEDACHVEVLWPSGSTQRLEGVFVDQRLMVTEPTAH